jgi:hypothetical protein
MEDKEVTVELEALTLLEKQAIGMKASKMKGHFKQKPKYF